MFAQQNYDYIQRKGKIETEKDGRTKMNYKADRQIRTTKENLEK